jgi:hypothetical protein
VFFPEVKQVLGQPICLHILSEIMPVVNMQLIFMLVAPVVLTHHKLE